MYTFPLTSIIAFKFSEVSFPTNNCVLTIIVLAIVFVEFKFPEIFTFPLTSNAHSGALV